jgi:hypothetical protein
VRTCVTHTERTLIMTRLTSNLIFGYFRQCPYRLQEQSPPLALSFPSSSVYCLLFSLSPSTFYSLSPSLLSSPLFFLLLSSLLSTQFVPFALDWLFINLLINRLTSSANFPFINFPLIHTTGWVSMTYLKPTVSRNK